jgi:hypothetical protein
MSPFRFFAFQCRLFSVIFSMSPFFFFNVAFVVQCRLFIFLFFMHEKWIVYPTLSPSNRLSLVYYTRSVSRTLSRGANRWTLVFEIHKNERATLNNKGDEKQKRRQWKTKKATLKK